MKKKILFIGLVALIFTGCTNSTESEEVESSAEITTTEIETDNAEKEIQPETETTSTDELPNTVIYNDEEVLFSDFAGQSAKYLFMDVTGDGNNELILRSDIFLYVIDPVSGKVLYEGTEYETPVNDGEHIGLLYVRKGGAPNHIDYYFYALDSDGTSTIADEFAWYDDNEDDQMDEDDTYFYKDIDDIVAMDFWIRMYQPYLDLAESEPEWIEYSAGILTTTDIDNEEIAEDRALDFYAAIPREYEGNICGKLDYLPEEPVISAEGQTIAIDREIDSDKVYYEVVSEGKVLFTTPFYDNQINVNQEFNLMDINKDDYDEILVTSFVCGTQGYVVGDCDLFSYADGEWKQTKIISDDQLKKISALAALTGENKGVSFNDGLVIRDTLFDKLKNCIVMKLDGNSDEETISLTGYLWAGQSGTINYSAVKIDGADEYAKAFYSDAGEEVSREIILSSEISAEVVDDSHIKAFFDLEKENCSLFNTATGNFE